MRQHFALENARKQVLEAHRFFDPLPRSATCGLEMTIAEYLQTKLVFPLHQRAPFLPMDTVMSLLFVRGLVHGLLTCQPHLASSLPYLA